MSLFESVDPVTSVAATPFQEVAESDWAPIDPPSPNRTFFKIDKLRRYVNGTVIAVLIDNISIAIGTAIGLFAYKAIGGHQIRNEGLTVAALSFQYAMTFVLFGRVHYLYGHAHTLLHIKETASILRVSFFSLALVSVGVFFSKMIVPRRLLVLSWIFATVVVLLQKHMTRPMLAGWKARLRNERLVLIIGCGSLARRVFSFLLNSPDLQLQPIGFFQEENAAAGPVIYSHAYRFKDHAPVYGGQLGPELIQRLGVTDIFVATEEVSSDLNKTLISLSLTRAARLSVVGSAHPYSQGRVSQVWEMDGLYVSSVARDHFNNVTAYRLCKRALDLAISCVVLIATFPMWIAIAIWIKLSSAGPIFFKQERIGQYGKPFLMYKFRSMYVTTPTYGRSPEDPRDPRITSAGRFLRKTSLDELPQILNIILGEMALVGPRPEMPYVVDSYGAQQSQRLRVPQGLTGIWQLSADRKFAIHESIEYDLYYLEHKGFFLDLAILVHTIFFAMKGI